MISDNQSNYLDIDESIFTDVVPRDLSDSDFIKPSDNIIPDSNVAPGITPIESKPETPIPADNKPDQDTSKPVDPANPEPKPIGSKSFGISSPKKFKLFSAKSWANNAG